MTFGYTETVFDSNSQYTGLGVPPFYPVGENMPVGYSDHIAALRKKLGMTQAQLAEAVGVEQPTVQRWETGKREPDFDTLSTLAQALGVDPADFFDPSVIVPIGPKLFVKGNVQAGQWNEAFELPEEEWREFYGRPDVTANIEHRFGLRVIGDSMNLKYPHGSIVECVSLFGRAEAVPGKRVVVLRERNDRKFEATIKKLVEQDGELWLVPESSNPAFRPFKLGGDEEEGIVETRIVAVVVRAVLDEE